MPPLELIVAAFDSTQKAQEALDHLRALEREGVVGIANAAVLVKDQDGRARIRETEDLTGPTGALFGAIAGALVGLLGGPAGMIVGAAAGAATGGLAAHSIDMGFDDALLKEIEAGLPPGSSAILALISHEWVDRIVEVLEELQARLYRQALKEEILARLPQPPAAGEQTDGAPEDAG
jgi:uncharacterized membrane protein